MERKHPAAAADAGSGRSGLVRLFESEDPVAAVGRVRQEVVRGYPGDRLTVLRESPYRESLRAADRIPSAFPPRPDAGC